jgi:hypothetical protein
MSTTPRNIRLVEVIRTDSSVPVVDVIEPVKSTVKPISASAPPEVPVPDHSPIPISSPIQVAASGLWSWLRGIDIRTVMIVMMAVFIIWNMMSSHISHVLPDWMVPPSVDVKAGQQLRAQLPGTLADGFDAMETDIRAGKSIADADQHLKTVFHDRRVEAFKATIYPVLSAVVPEGGEVTPETREPYAQKCHAIAIGLRGKNH